MLLATLITLGTAAAEIETVFHHVRICSVDRLGVVAVVGELRDGQRPRIEAALVEGGWTRADAERYVRGDEIASLGPDTLTIRPRDLDDRVLRRLAAAT